MSKKKKYHSIFKDLDNAPEKPYWSIICYCLNCNNRWSFVPSDNIKYLKDMDIEEMKPDYIQLYNMLHQYAPDSEKMKDIIIKKYKKIISELPGAIIMSIENAENTAQEIHRFIDILQHNIKITISLNLYYGTLKKSDPEYDIMCEYGKYFLVQLICDDSSKENLLLKLIDNKSRYDEFISVEERFEKIEEMWEYFLHSSETYCVMNLFQEFLNTLERNAIFKSDFDFCINIFKYHISSNEISKCAEYILRNKK